jgi:hypothetical protein
VGVGTTSPQSRVGIQTSDGAYGFTHTNGTVTVGTYTGLAAGWFGTRSNHPLHFFTNNGLAQVTLGTNGNFGIGTTNPSQKLEVNGIVRTTSAVGDCPIGWFCSLQGWDASVASLYYSGLSQRSDARLKRNIRPLNEIRGRLFALSGVSYEWREGKPGTRYGFIAQQVEEVFPELVSTDDRGYKSVDYIALIPFTVETIKAQQRSIHDLEFRLAQLEAALDRYRVTSEPSNRVRTSRRNETRGSNATFRRRNGRGR